ncbi:class I SAM-dependent methyltransferase, partial [Burkholderia sp. SIMBA_019]|uniref:class I SAM-dependent methyltransferase n=1 Tax=Burkholderia sp. SIMBA_019 TaxID=3085765 RepID=UPI0039781ED3
GGRLAIEDSLGGATLGQGSAVVRLTIRDMAFYRLVATQGSVGAGEAFGDGMWTCDDLVSLVRLLVRNRDTLDTMESGLARLAGWALKRWHAANRNTPEGSRRNIAAHYDLGNDFFSLFLSPDLMYSSALW